LPEHLNPPNFPITSGLRRIQFSFSTVILLTFALSVKAQVNTKIYMALSGGYGKLNGVETYSNHYRIKQSTVNESVTNVPFAVNFHFNSIGKRRFNVGAFGSFMAGAGNSKYRSTSPYNNDNNSSALNPSIAVRLGPQINYLSNDTNFVIGFRYFNWYMDEGLRTYYNIPDDGAALGIYIANKQFALDINYAPKNLPGLLVENISNHFQVELRYKANKNLKNTNISRIFGLRYEYSNYVRPNNQSFNFYWDPTSLKTTSNFVSLLVGYSFNK